MIRVIATTTRLTRDPELKYTQSGSPIASFGVADSQKWKDTNGQQQERTTFADCDVFGKQAEAIANFFKKGDPIILHGSLEMDQWQDRNTGQNRTKLKIKVEKFEFPIGKPRDNSQGGGYQQPQGQPQQQRGQQPQQGFPGQQAAPNNTAQFSQQGQFGQQQQQGGFPGAQQQPQTQPQYGGQQPPAQGWQQPDEDDVPF